MPFLYSSNDITPYECCKFTLIVVINVCLPHFVTFVQHQHPKRQDELPPLQARVKRSLQDPQVGQARVKGRPRGRDPAAAARHRTLDQQKGAEQAHQR